MAKQVAAERMRIVRKMNSEKSSGMPVQPAQPSYQVMQTCGEHFHKHGLLVIDSNELENK